MEVPCVCLRVFAAHEPRLGRGVEVDQDDGADRKLPQLEAAAARQPGGPGATRMARPEAQGPGQQDPPQPSPTGRRRARGRGKSPSLFVAHRSDALQELFRKTVGPLKEVFLIYNSQGRSKGMAVVAFQRSGDAAVARAKYDGKFIDGRKCPSRRALSRPDIPVQDVQ